jgi:hypothetical protein
MKKSDKTHSEEVLRRWAFVKECLREGLKDAEGQKQPARGKSEHDDPPHTPHH